MTTTEMYRLATFFHFVYCDILYSMPGQLMHAEHMYSALIVRSITKIQACIWLKRTERYSLAAIQTAVLNHLKLVRSVCNILLRTGSVGKRVRQRTNSIIARAKSSKEANSAVAFLDKPNLHRLYEFAHVTLPAIGHASLSQELHCEKVHTKMKRAIETSNNKAPQTFSINTAAFNDWQGRMSLLSLPLSQSTSTREMRFASRLLVGSSAIASLSFPLSTNQLSTLTKVLGGAVHSQIGNIEYGRSVLPRPSPTGDEIEWYVQSNGSISWRHRTAPPILITPTIQESIWDIARTISPGAVLDDNSYCFFIQKLKWRNTSIRQGAVMYDEMQWIRNHSSQSSSPLACPFSHVRNLLKVCVHESKEIYLLLVTPCVWSNTDAFDIGRLWNNSSEHTESEQQNLLLSF